MTRLSPAVGVETGEGFGWPSSNVIRQYGLPRLHRQTKLIAVGYVRSTCVHASSCYGAISFHFLMRQATPFFLLRPSGNSNSLIRCLLYLFCFFSFSTLFLLLHFDVSFTKLQQTKKHKIEIPSARLVKSRTLQSWSWRRVKRVGTHSTFSHVTRHVCVCVSWWTSQLIISPVLELLVPLFLLSINKTRVRDFVYPWRCWRRRGFVRRLCPALIFLEWKDKK